MKTVTQYFTGMFLLIILIKPEIFPRMETWISRLTSFREVSDDNEGNYQSIFPPIEFCGDNAAMIAMVGLEKFKLKQFDNLDHPAKPRWPLDENAVFLKGAGVQL